MSEIEMSEIEPIADDLLEAAHRVLERAGFAVRREALADSGHDWVVAENDLFALGLVAGLTLESLEPIESIATHALVTRLGATRASAKRWDAYLVLMTPQPWEEIDSRDRVELTHNTRGVRRLVGAELVPSEDEGSDLEQVVAGTLRTFLPLGDPLGGNLVNLDDGLVEALVLNGIRRDDAQRYVAAFWTRGTLEDV